MESLLRSGQLLDLILVLIVLEAALLGWLRARTGRGPPPRALVINLASGASLMLAVRFALTDAPWTWVAGMLTVALLAHLADLAVRWQSGDSPGR